MRHITGRQSDHVTYLINKRSVSALHVVNEPPRDRRLLLHFSIAPLTLWTRPVLQDGVHPTYGGV